MYEDILSKVGQYYSEKIRIYGPTAQGADWNSRESQEIRFRQILKVIPEKTSPFSILDYGCGWGALFAYLIERFGKDFFEYWGYDISLEQIQKAKEIFSGTEARFSHVLEFDRMYDYVVTSGIFNVKLDTDDERWKSYILDTIHTLNGLSKKGFSFNVLTKYSDKEYMKDYLFYADPCFIFDYCKKNFSKNVALFHDYELYEFTIVVRKE